MVGQYFEKMLEICGLIDDTDCPKAGRHRDMERAEIKKSEETVQHTISMTRNAGQKWVEQILRGQLTCQSSKVNSRTLLAEIILH